MRLKIDHPLSEALRWLAADKSCVDVVRELVACEVEKRGGRLIYGPDRPSAPGRPRMYGFFRGGDHV